MKKVAFFLYFLLLIFSANAETVVELTVDKNIDCYSGTGSQLITLTATVIDPPETYPYKIQFLEDTEIELPVIIINNASEVLETYIHTETFQQYSHTYQVRVVDQDDLPIASSNTETLTVYQLANVTVNQNQPIVLSQSAPPENLRNLLTVTHPTGVTPNFQYQFTGSGLINGNTEFDPSSVSVGEHTINYTVTDDGNCPVNGTISFSVVEDVSITINGSTSEQLCRTSVDGTEQPVSAVTLSIQPPAAVSGVTYRYRYHRIRNGTTSQIHEGTETSYNYTALGNGLYEFYVEVQSSSNGASYKTISTTETVTLNVYRTPVATVDDPPAPLDKNAREIDLESTDYINVSYPSSGYSIEFEPHPGMSGSYFFPSSVEAGTHKVYVTIRDNADNAGLCALEDSIKIIVLAEPELSHFLAYLESPPVCESYESFLLTATIDTSCLNFKPKTYIFPFFGSVTLMVPPDTIIFSADYFTGPTDIIGTIESYSSLDGLATYRFEINPSLHDINNNYRISITPVPGTPGFKTGCTQYVGKIPIDPGGDPSIIGLPVKDPLIPEEAWICSASYDTLQMRGSPASGSYDFYLGYIDELGAFQPTDTLPADSTISQFESPPGERSLVKIVPADLLNIYGQTYGLNTAIKVDYTYPLMGKCPETTTKYIRFSPGIDIKLNQTLDKAFCDGDTVKLSVDYSNYPYGVNDKFYWSFGDGFSTEYISDTAISHFYRSPGMYKFQFKTQMETITPDSACNIHIFDTIYIGAQPIADFDVFKNFEDTAAVFSSTSTLVLENESTNEDTITTWHWEFGDQGNTSHTSTLRGDTTFTYTGVSRDPYEASLTVTSGWGCQDTKTRSIPVFPVKIPMPETSIAEGFASSDITGWFNSGSYLDRDTISSWVNMVPAGNRITELPGGGETWITAENPDTASGYYRNEASWIESPVFDITNLQLPMVSIDTWINSDLLFDGASVQYAIVDSVAFGKEDWITLGGMNEGIGWYNSQTIIGQPGNDFKGWTGDTATAWQLSAFKLNHLLDSLAKYDSKLLRFRIVLGTNNDNMPGKEFDGFAFDNFFVGERNRKVIVEEFCDNANYEPGVSEVFKDPQAIRIQYHVSAKTSGDVINEANPADPSARALTYGIGKHVPTGVIDGIHANNEQGLLQGGWGENAFLKRSLMIAPFRITITPPQVVNGKLKIEAGIDRLEGNINGPFIVHVAVVEKEVTANGLPFTNVLRNLLPNAAGTRIPAGHDWSQPYEITQEWQPYIQPGSGLMAVVFIQDEVTREIYQSNYDSLSVADTTDLVPVPNKQGASSVQPAFTEVYLAPNPTDGDVTVTLNGITKSPVSLSIVNQMGQIVQTVSIAKNVNAAVISTEQLGPGIYYMVLNTETGKIVKKFSVVK